MQGFSYTERKLISIGTWQSVEALPSIQEGEETVSGLMPSFADAPMHVSRVSPPPAVKVKKLSTISAQYCKETAFQLSIPRKLCGILRYTVKLHLKLWLSSVCEWNNSWNPPMPFRKRGNLSMVFKTTWGHRFMTRGERFRDLKGPFWPVWSVWWKQRCWHHFRCVWMNT